MSRLTDEQVAFVADHGASTSARLATEVAAYRAMRPKCPTCDGSGIDPLHRAVPDQAHLRRACPANCGDGFMPLADWVKLLRTTLDEVEDGIASEVAYDRLNAVLKMAGDQ